jgi:hypothetical protein
MPTQQEGGKHPSPATAGLLSTLALNHAALTAGRKLWQRKAQHMQMLGMTWMNAGADTTDGGETHVLLDAPRHPHACDLYVFWQAAQASGGLRIRRDVPSRALSPLLSQLTLYEPVEGGMDFRARVVGTAALRRFGVETTGSLLSEMFDDAGFRRRRRNMRGLLDTGRPYALDVEARASDGALRLHFEVLTVPVWSPEGRTRWVLSGVFYWDWPRFFKAEAEPAPRFC